MASHTPANNIGLALSGGGYRASVFHLGTLKKLHELKILDKVDVISTISGGSITGAAWCLYDGPYELFHAEMLKKFKTQGVIKRIIFSFTFLFALIVLIGLLVFSIWLTFTDYSRWAYLVFLLWLLVIIFFQFKVFPVSKEIEKAYDEIFYQKRKLGELTQKHIIAIGSSNLHTGRPFTFSRDRMGDSMYSNWPIYKKVVVPGEGEQAVRESIDIKFQSERFPISRAVAASSCVPFAFTPISIAEEFFLNEEYFEKVTPVLVDGGVYDNQGIQKLTQYKSGYECKVIITSDAGGKFVSEGRYRNVISLLMRTVNLFMYRIKASQMVQNIYRNTEDEGKPIAYFSLGWNLNEIIPGFVNAMCNGQVLREVMDCHGFETAWIDNPRGFREQIARKVKENVKYDEIYARNVKEPWLSKAKRTGTGLSKLSKERIAALVQHAENLTELQVRLYCPMLIKG